LGLILCLYCTQSITLLNRTCYMSVAASLCILLISVLEGQVLGATHDDMFLLQTKLEMQKPQRDKALRAGEEEISTQGKPGEDPPWFAIWLRACREDSRQFDGAFLHTDEQGLLWMVTVTLQTLQSVDRIYLLGAAAIIGTCFFFCCCCCCCRLLFGSSAEPAGAEAMLERANSFSSLGGPGDPTDVYVEQASSVGSFGSRNRNPRDVVEDLGFGLAQVKVMMLAELPAVIGQIYEVLVTTAATSVASSLGLSAYERGLVVAASGIGRILGSMVGGWLGDRFGRRPALVLSNILMAAAALGMSFAPDFTSLFACHAAFGFSHSIGLLSSNIIIIELTPKTWRVSMLVLNSFLFVASGVVADVICLRLDPTLEALDWRYLFSLPAAPLAAMFVLTGLFLDESPVFSACIGDHAQAQRGFESMRRLNGRPDVSISYTDSTLTFDLYEDSSWTGPFWNNMSVLFSYGVFGCTLALTLLRLLEVFAYMARNYGMTRVFIVEAESMDLTPGLQVLVARLWGFAALLFPLTLDRLLSRKGMLFVSLSTLAIAYSAFAWSEHSDQENWEVSTMLQTSIAVERFMLKVISMISSIVIVECFPTEMRTTSYALIGILGKFAGIAGPVMFEWFYMQFHMVTAFFYFLSGFAFFVGLTVVCLLPGNLEIPQLIASERLKAMRLEGGSHQVLASAAETPAEEASVEEPAKEAPAEELPAERAPSRQETPVEVRAHRSPRSQKCVAM